MVVLWGGGWVSGIEPSPPACKTYTPASLLISLARLFSCSSHFLLLAFLLSHSLAQTLFIILSLALTSKLRESQYQKQRSTLKVNEANVSLAPDRL